MKTYIAIFTACLLGIPAAFASSNTVGFNANEARFYCEDLADSYQIFPQDRMLYLSRCVSDYRLSPPGGNGSSISPHAAGY